MSPTSSDPRKRARQLANLRKAPPAPPTGNSRAMTHGAYAAVALSRLDSQAREIFEALAADAPLRDVTGGLPSHDGVAVRLLAEALCRLDDVSAYLARAGWADGKGRVRPAVEIEQRLRREVADHLDALGMTPRSRARLGLDLTRSYDLAEQMAKGDDDR